MPGRSVVLFALVIAFVFGVPNGSAASADDQSIFCSEFLPNEKASWVKPAVLWKWAEANPGEVSRFSAFADELCAGGNPGSLPAMASLHGLSLVAVGKLALSDAPPPPPPPNDTEPPAAPTNQAVDPTQTTIAMSWDAATDNVGVDHYNVFLDDVQVAEPTGLAHTYTDLACSITYVVALEAEDAAGNVSDRAEAQGTVTTDACDPPPPPPPSPQCSDLLDNDGDGDIDLADDGCSSAADDDESDDPPPPPPSGDVANVWVDLNGGSCERFAPVAYSDTSACDSLQAGYAAAQGGDVIRVKSGTYLGPQSVGGSKTPIINVIGEDGTQIESVLLSGGGVRGLSMGGNVTVSNVDVGGPQPFIFVGGANSTWRDSRLLESCSTNLCARGTHSGVPEPILIYSDNATPITNATIGPNVVVEPQHVCTPGQGNCGSGDVYHLESVRIDQNVDGVLIDRVTFLSGGDDNTALIFITAPSAQGDRPRNITIQNSVFGNHGGSYNIDFGGSCQNYVFAYNTFTKERLNACLQGPGPIQWIGNVGPKSPSGLNCTPNTIWAKNVWQWGSDPRVCSGESTSTWVPGPNFSISEMGLDANYRPLAGSPVIDAGESSYCTGALGGIDRDGKARPTGATCDAGAFER